LRLETAHPSTDRRVTGTLVHPSDQRIKEDVQPADPSKQLDNIRNIRLYDYKLKPAWAETANRTDRVCCVMSLSLPIDALTHSVSLGFSVCFSACLSPRTFLSN
jgi:hypothetical protein